MRPTNRICAGSSFPSLPGKLLIALCLLQSCLAAKAEPQPIVATTGTDFFGYDGLWSAVSIRLGSPQQWLSLLPSTLSQETWVVGASGCDGTSTCEALRGGLFLTNESSTFQPQGLYELNFDTQLGYSGSGYYGLDTVYLDDVYSAPGQIVAVVNSTDQWLGSLGLGVQQTRFGGTENYLPLLSSLVENGSLIPSHSYGYTAGAFYRLKSVPASLTLGGIDANRFVPNDMTFSLSTDYAPIVAINSITVSSSPSNGESLPNNWDSNPQTLLDGSQADLFTIDSSTPFLWLPDEVCDSFANSLNLTYDDNLQLYLFPDDNLSSPDALTAWNLTFTFALSNLPGSSDVIELTLPYDAFNLQLTYPFPNLDANFTSPPTNYFPLRKAANSTQYTIGRAFLQETYLTVDYERNNFSISQAVFTLDAVSNVNLMAISRPEDSIWPGPASSADSGLSTGAKVGIGVGAAVGVLIVVGLAWMFCFRKRSSKGSSSGEKTKRRSLLSRIHRAPDSKTSVSELLGDKRHPTEVPADPSVSRFELSGNTPIEMPAAPVSPRYFASSEDGTRRESAVMRNDPRRPAELEHRTSMTKSGDVAASERSGSPVPPYSPAEINNNRNSSSVSPYSPRNSRGFGTISSGEQGISPVAGSDGHSHQSSNSNSRSMPSPVSPEAVSRPQRQFSSGSNISPSTNTSHNTLLIPQLHGRPPSRSPSTGSRFVEEGLSTVTEEQVTNTSARSNHPGPRFSWEQ
ncbi:uncharacterized protein Z518_10976 [Rhinocladiella mackenziei CBS 650.93]|uniref:Rhinocladiella mackenziei CBS 650.93 unplaced genomic scaffold supercont1.10, whole genome shotgun sequence n=1 Tax=Rhinocladiella mackenziei CBS 650.93 TaxID=1442369 RepID=A0A0D2I2T7_9EURO|nr:uncharacterized protein Z518_10976 [Rhinocladiella mackenziei CBS 650.93]KIX00049.1 hypothetical protein Z518_10976 [Rhinocladiella mackenziei CBS 650.93]